MFIILIISYWLVGFFYLLRDTAKDFGEIKISDLFLASFCSLIFPFILLEDLLYLTWKKASKIQIRDKVIWKKKPK